MEVYHLSSLVNKLERSYLGTVCAAICDRPLLILRLIKALANLGFYSPLWRYAVS